MSHPDRRAVLRSGLAAAALGAVGAATGFIVLADTEGNRFCIVDLCHEHA